MATPVSRVLRHFSATPNESAGRLSVAVKMCEVQHDEEKEDEASLTPNVLHNVLKHRYNSGKFVKKKERKKEVSI